MKKLSVLMIFGILFLTGCESSNLEYDSKNLISKEKLPKLYVTPEDYVNKSVDLDVYINDIPAYNSEKDGYFTYGTTDKDETNYVVLRTSEELNSTFEFKENQYLKIQGVVEKGLEEDGKKVPLITVTSVEESTYVDSFSPSLKTVELNSKVEQNDVTVTVPKVEFAKENTRVYMDIENNAKNTFNFYSFDSYIQLDGGKIEGNDYIETIGADIETIADGEVLAGESISGYLVFGPVDYEKEAKIKFMLSDSDFVDDYDTEFKSFDYRIK